MQQLAMTVKPGPLLNPFRNGGLLSGQYAMVFQAMARNNIAGLESRAANVGCTAAFSSQSLSTNVVSPIQQCVTTCKANTSRTPEQCFDSSNH